MLNRNLRIALFVSLGMHIMVMSLVGIVVPEDVGRLRPYTKVNFLGPVLGKTAFDIMLENATPSIFSFSRNAAFLPQEISLKIMEKKRRKILAAIPETFAAENSDDIAGYLKSKKVVPKSEIFNRSEGSSDVTKTVSQVTAEEKRKILYKPEPPVLFRGLYGDKSSFKINFRVLVDADGKVLKAEPLMTTGYPQLDIMACKFIRGWIFSPKDTGAEICDEEWHEIDILLNTGA
ncbi:MAG: hypothetical protein ABH869_01215 [Candidatus Omnitrophota bacterium]